MSLQPMSQRRTSGQQQRLIRCCIKCNYYTNENGCQTAAARACKRSTRPAANVTISPAPVKRYALASPWPVPACTCQANLALMQLCATILPVSRDAPVAQWIRASPCGGEGQAFESPLGYHTACCSKESVHRDRLFFLPCQSAPVGTLFSLR